MTHHRRHRRRAQAQLVGLLLAFLVGQLHLVTGAHGLGSDGRLVERHGDSDSDGGQVPPTQSDEDPCVVWAGLSSTLAVEVSVVVVEDRWPVVEVAERRASPRARQRQWALAPKQSPPQPG